MTNVIQKPGKPKGTVENFEPITLLSILQKILVIFVKKQIIPEIDSKTAPCQAVYRKGRSTSEYVFATKLLVEKSRTSQNRTVYFIIIDVSKAFDTVDRTIEI